MPQVPRHWTAEIKRYLLRY